MEHSSLKQLGFAIALVLMAAPGVGQDEAQPYFSLAANRTFASNSGATINLSATNVDALEFRVYRVNDAVQFFDQLQSPTNFGNRTELAARPRTWIENIRAWKRGLRADIRRSLRAQFTEPPHEHYDAWLPSGETGSRPKTKEIRYVQAPVLNSQQLVLTFLHPVQGRGRWVYEPVDIGVREKGVYVVEAVKGDLHAYTVLMVSDLVLTTKTGRGKIMAFVTDRATGEPVADADLWMLSPGKPRVQAKTSAEGLVDLPLATAKPDDIRIVARRGADVGVNALASYAFNVNEDQWLGYVYTDRPIYRPGHTVHFKGLVRVRTPDGNRLPQVSNMLVEIQDAAGKTVYQKQLPLSANGTLRGELTLPADAALGNYSMEAKSGDNRISGNFDVQEYKKPEYEVRVTAQQPRVLQGASNTLLVDAHYFFGEPVAGAAVKYSVYRDRYWFPLWRDPDDEDTPDGAGGPDQDADNYGDEVTQGEGKLNEMGQLTITVPSEVNEHKADLRYRVEARVTDEARREITGAGGFLATYGSFLVNATTDRYVYTPGAKVQVTVEARNYDSQPVQTQAKVELLRWNQKNKDYDVRGSASTTTSADGKGMAELQIPNEGGSFEIRASARTPEGRVVQDYAYVWISGGGDLFDTSRQVLNIITDKKTYQPGETAHLMIPAPDGAAVLATVEGRDLRSRQLVRAKNGSASFDVPVALRDQPGFYVSAQLMRQGNLFRGSRFIRVPADDHKLAITVSTDKPQYQPGAPAVYSLDVRDAAGKPVPRAELSVGVVDEAIYAIQPDTTPEPLRQFYGHDYNPVNTEDSLNYYFNGEAGKRVMQLAQLRAPSKLAQLKPERLVVPKVRKAFPDTAFWADDVMTDAQGRAQARVTFPDSLTTWRATARAITADTKVGVAVAKTIVRKNIILRLSTPRFFTRGDEMVISALVHNYLTDAKEAKVSLEATGLELLNGEAKTVMVPARGEVRVDYRVRASKMGTAKITGRALTNEESDALEQEIPVLAPGVPLSISKGGSMPAGNSAALDLPFPQTVEAGSRRMLIRLSPSIAGALFGAVEYLTTFPYGCVEQTMSSFLPNVIVQQAVKDLKLNVNLDQAQLHEKIASGLDRLYAFQHDDGGWGWWETDATHPFMTAYVVAGLEQAKATGMMVREDVLDKGAHWVSKALAEQELAPDLRAYLAYALSTRADAVPFDKIFGDRAKMSPYGLALLGLALEQRKDGRAGQLAQALEAAVKQDAEQAWWQAERDEMLDFSADVSPEATAFAVRFLSHQRPASPLLAKASVWLMNHRNEGYWWSSTKQTAMVIYGLTDYLKVSKELMPHFTATVMVNGKQLLTKRFETVGVNEPELALSEGDLQATGNHVQITTMGEGRLYYSARAEYSSSEEKLERKGAVSLNILREYFRLVPGKEKDRIVYDTKSLDGPVASGDVIAVRLTVTGNQWRYLMIEDPIPAGTEFIAREQAYELREKPPWWEFYFTRRELHDNRMAIFETEFPQGQRDYFYLLKVINPGRFAVSPARVQPMYQPGIIATSAKRTLEVQQ